MLDIDLIIFIGITMSVLLFLGLVAYNIRRISLYTAHLKEQIESLEVSGLSNGYPIHVSRNVYSKLDRVLSDYIGIEVDEIIIAEITNKLEILLREYNLGHLSPILTMNNDDTLELRLLKKEL